ncbi:hypothetical protein [Pseudomonas coronafaciens]|uniref:hypothetical protein n=1 Tax=Pseudomonas coronafaciens TaxID=53409 RepID=UPI0032DC9B2D
MLNPFNRITKSEDKTRYYTKNYDAADGLIEAVLLENGAASLILHSASKKMDINNECEVTIAALDNLIRAKDPATRTKALNILRLTKLADITIDNRNAMVRLRINSRAYYRFGEDSSAKKNCYNEELNFGCLDSEGYLCKQEIKNFRVSKKVKARKMEEDIAEALKNY